MQKFNNNENIKYNVERLKVDIFDDVTLTPMYGDITGEIDLFAQGAYAKGASLKQVRRMIDKDIRFLSLPYIKPWKISSQEVIYGGIFFMHYGHFLLEVLQRLWYTQKSDLPIVWTGVNGFTYTPSEFKSWQKDIFQNLGIKNKHIFLTEPTQFAKVHFPEPGSGINTHLHPEHAKFLAYHESTPVNGKYVYFSRARVRSCANEEQIEKLLKARGWHIIYPEKLTVHEQLKALSSAEVCFMIGGSAQHTMLLAKNLQTRFIVIPRGNDTTYNIIANIKSDNYYEFNLEKTIVYSDPTNAANDFFTLDITTLNDVLEKTFDFTKNIELFSNLLVKPPKLSAERFNVPQKYYKPIPPVNLGRKLYFIAYFFYQKKKYTLAHKIFLHLQKRDLLEDFMYFTYFNAVQQYHLQERASIHLPLEKHQYHVNMLRQAIAKNPHDLKRYKNLTRLFLIAGQFNDALRLQTQLAKLYSDWSKPLSQIAYIYSLLQNFEQAITFAQKAVNAEPHKLKRKAELAEYLCKAKTYAQAKKLLAETLQTNPRWEEGYRQLAKIHKAEGSLQKALACAQKAVTLAPDSTLAQEQLAECLREQGDISASIEILAKALQHNPRLAERYAQNAHIYELVGNLPKAIEYATKAVEMEPRNFACKKQLATYFRLNKNYDELFELMQEALHKNPFWSEPYAQYAAMHAAKGDLVAAIDNARIAYAVEPYNSLRKQELEDYRIKKIQQQENEQNLQTILKNRHSTTRQRIQTYIDIFYAHNYLELNAELGENFLNIEIAYKIGVAPSFQFKMDEHISEQVALYSEASDVFFSKFPQYAKYLVKKSSHKSFKFDVIFIAGSHSFEQTLRDFENSLAHSHHKSIWIIDDTVPNKHLSTLVSHPDTFKAIFTIHDMYPEFSYCTQINNGTPQTILWRTPKPSNRKKIFTAQEFIAKLNYEDFQKNSWILHPVNDAEVIGKIFLHIDPLDFKIS